MKIRYLFLLCSISSLSISCFIKRTVSTPNVMGTKWTLISLGNTALKVSELHSSIHFKSNGEIHAVAVCNTISGRYFADSRSMKLRMSALIISYLGCHDLKTEAILLEALKATNKYVIKEDTLLLLRDDKKLATYKRTELP
jgi:heat shock protein HslJ